LNKGKVELITKELFAKTLKMNTFLINIAMRIMNIPKLNRFYRSLLPAKSTAELFQKALKARKISIDVDKKLIEQLPNEPFIIISNHAHGILDGLILVTLLNEKYPGFKLTASYHIAQLEPLSGSLIPVSPFKDANYKPMGGTNKVFELLKQGHPVGLFPAAGVATYYRKSKEITDQPWREKAIRLIKKAQVPILPLYIWGKNSCMFYFFKKIHWTLGSLRMIKEFFKKKNISVHVEIGRIIKPEEYNVYNNLEELGAFLRNEVFRLKNYSV